MRYIDMNPVVRYLLIQADICERDTYFDSVARTAAVDSFYERMSLDVEGGTIFYWPLEGRFTVAAVGLEGHTPYISYTEVLALIRVTYPRRVSLTESDIEGDDEMGWEILSDEDIEVIDPIGQWVERKRQTYKNTPPPLVKVKEHIGAEPVYLRTMLRDVG